MAEENVRRPQSDLPLAGETIFKSRYMDDSSNCVPDVKTGVELNGHLSQLWGFAEINVRKWLSNEPEIICNFFVICLPTKQLGVLMNLFKQVCVFQIELEFGSVGLRTGKSECPEKNLSKQEKEPTTNSTLSPIWPGRAYW